MDRVQRLEVTGVLGVKQEHIRVSSVLSTLRHLRMVDAHSAVVAMSVLFIAFNPELGCFLLSTSQLSNCQRKGNTSVMDGVRSFLES